LQPMYYRGCWHIVSRCLFTKYSQFNIISYTKLSSFIKELYDPKTFIIHAALLHQGFPHCEKFLTAASRRSMGRVSVPLWLFRLSAQLHVIGLVGHYPTNYLIWRTLILKWWFNPPLNIFSCDNNVLCGIS
jgi:hypothetical protein